MNTRDGYYLRFYKKLLAFRDTFDNDYPEELELTIAALDTTLIVLKAKALVERHFGDLSVRALEEGGGRGFLKALKRLTKKACESWDEETEAHDEKKTS